MLGWLGALPDELVMIRPVLSVHYAGTLLQTGALDHVEARLQDAAQWLDMAENVAVQPVGATEMVVADSEEFRRLPSWIAIYRAGLAQVRGNVADALHHSQRALDLIHVDDHLGHGAAATLMGLAYWTSGNLESARRLYAEGMPHVQKAGHLSDFIGCAIALADIQLAQGRLHAALSTYTRGLQLAAAQGTHMLRGAADMYVGMSNLQRERGDLNASTHSLLRSKEMGEFAGLLQNPYRWRVAMARIRQAQGDLEGALDLLQEAERLYVGDFLPNVHPVAAFTTRVWIVQGRLGEALGWVHEHELTAADDLSYLREFEHVTLARVLLMQSHSDPAGHGPGEAMQLLARLLQAAEEGERKGSVIEILILQALAHHSLGNIPAALAPLQRALALAEPEGYIRIFVDEGPPMADLLRQAAAHVIKPAYAGRLLAAFEPGPQGSASEAPLRSAPAAQPLIEPLSQRELEVLRLFKTDLSGPEIARQLVIALSTLRTHTKSIYSKLNVENRRAAVKRSAELGVI